MLSKRYSGRADNPRVFAHQASDDIVALTQYRGVARTKIAFTSDRDATREHRSKELYIVDYDGFNPRRITVNNSLNILPAWSPDGQKLAAGSTVHVLDAATGASAQTLLDADGALACWAAL